MSKRWMGELCLYLTSIFYLFLLTGVGQDPLKQTISTHCDKLLAEPEIDALSLGIIHQGKTYKFHKGRLLDGAIPSDESLYEIASLTKTFTGVLIAQAVRDKKISLNEDIRSYLPGDYPNLAYDGQPISVRNVITHESGLPRMLPDMDDLFEEPNFDTLPTEIRKRQKGYGKAEFYRDLGKVSIDTIPGHNFSYSNAGANLLGYILEEVYQQAFEQLIQKTIFHPLAMENTYTHWSKVKTNTLVEGQSHKKVHMPFMPEKYMSAEGGIVSNVDDMLKYMDFQLDTDNPLISISHQELWDRKYGDYETGFFWQIIKNETQPDYFYQNGGAFGTSSWITLVPEKGIGIFLVSNTSGPEIHQKLKDTVDGILEALEQ